MLDIKPDVSNNPPGEREDRGEASREQRPQGPGEPPPGLKDKDAPTSDTYGNTRDSGEPASR
jgi:hypothetical protein